MKSEHSGALFELVNTPIRHCKFFGVQGVLNKLQTPDRGGAVSPIIETEQKPIIIEFFWSLSNHKNRAFPPNFGDQKTELNRIFTFHYGIAT